MVWIVLLLLLAAALGVLGALLKAVLVVGLGIVLAVVIITFAGYYYVRHKFRRFVTEAQRQQGMQPGQPGPPQGYPTTGTKGPDPSLPPGSPPQ
jgi:hypothetical protein